MKKIQFENVHFTQSPLAVIFEIEKNGKGNVRKFELELTADLARSRSIARCTGTLFNDDIERLGNELENLVSIENTSIDYAPMEPSFLLRGQALKDDHVELNWVIDQGMLESDFSTDTGIGILMNVSKEAIQKVLESLRSIL